MDDDEDGHHTGWEKKGSKPTVKTSSPPQKDALPDWILVCAAMMMMNPPKRSKETDSEDKV